MLGTFGVFLMLVLAVFSVFAILAIMAVLSILAMAAPAASTTLTSVATVAAFPSITAIPSIATVSTIAAVSTFPAVSAVSATPVSTILTIMSVLAILAVIAVLSVVARRILGSGVPPNPLANELVGTAPRPANLHVPALAVCQVEFSGFVELTEPDPVFLVQLAVSHLDQLGGIGWVETGKVCREGGIQCLVCVKRDCNEVLNVLEPLAAVFPARRLVAVIVQPAFSVHVADKGIGGEELVETSGVAVVLRLNQMGLRPVGVDSCLGCTGCQGAGEGRRRGTRDEG